MRTVTQNICKFEELSEKAQAKVLADNSELLTGYGWWSDTVKEDAKGTAGLDIEEFDLYPPYIKANFTTSAKSSALKVVSEHGEHCATYSIAKKFLSDLDELERQEDTAKTEAELEELEEAYLEDLSREYLNMLENEYEYLCSEEAISDHIIDNGWEFYEDGRGYMS